MLISLSHSVWSLACALAPNFHSLVIFRVLQGFSSAGGSVTLGIVADMFEPERQGMAVACKSDTPGVTVPKIHLICSSSVIVFSSVGGSVLGPIVGAFQARYLSWHWNVSPQLPCRPIETSVLERFTDFGRFVFQFWLQLIFGVAVQILQIFTPETKASILTTRIAKRKRANGEEVYSSHEPEDRKWDPKEILQIMARPVSSNA